MSLPPKNNDTPTPLIVKEKKSPDTPNKKVFQMQLQGVFLMGFSDACKDRGETPQQLITDVLERFLLQEKYLPEWWLTRKI